IPMILINGADGIGTGWSTNIPNYNPKDVIRNIRRMLDDQPLEEMTPFYRNFIGTIKKIEAGRYQIDGVWEEDDGEVIISELPIGQWTSVFTAYLDDLAAKNIIEGYTSQSSDKTVNLKVQLKEKKVNLKLSTTISTNNMVCFDKNLKIKKYDTPEDIIKDFYYVRLSYYMKRKEKLLFVLSENMLKLENKVRFIKEVVNDELIINKRKKSDLIDELRIKEYVEFDNFSYLLSMEILSLTEERIDKLNKELSDRIDEYNTLQGKTPKDLWREDLDEFEVAYDKIVEYEEEVYQKAREGSESLKDKRKKKKNTSIKKKKTTEVVIKDGKKTVKKILKAEKSVVTKKSTIKKGISDNVNKKTKSKKDSKIYEELNQKRV
ncbi:MAG: DNA gyrase subunit A, partial [Lactobacillaceae bacterium]